MIIEMSILHSVDTCTRSKVITYRLESSSGFHGAMYVEQKIEYHSVHRNACTRSKVITYRLESSSGFQRNVCGTKKDRVTQ